MPADLPEDSGARTAALSPILPPGYAASGPTAAWVHGVGDAPPLRHHVQRAADRRPRVALHRNVIVHEGQLPPNDLVFIAAVPVTTPLRTLTDLVLTAGRHDECALWMRAMAQAHPVLIRQVETLLTARSRMPGKRAALAMIAELLIEDDQDVTRYTS